MKEEKGYVYINSQWRIGSDAYNLILENKKKVTDRKTKEEKEVWQTVGYYGTYKGVLHAFVDKELMHMDSFKALVDKIEELHELISNLDIPRR